MKSLRTNSKEVRSKVKEHIINSYDDITDLYANLDNLVDNRQVFSIYQAGKKLTEDGAFLVYYNQVQDFLNGLGINAENKEYSDEKSWKLYVHLMASECEKLYNNKGVK